MATEIQLAAPESLSVSDLFSGRTVLCDGAMGTMLYSRGVFINRCYDELNLSQPDLVRTVHMEYLQAGAEVIETNTFGANAVRLEHFGLEGKVREINRAGVRLARESVNQIAEKQSMVAYVAGAIGPLGVRLEPHGRLAIDQARDAFAEQIRGLIEGGPGVGADLLIAETISALDEAKCIIEATSEVAPGLPLAVLLTVDDEGRCLDGELAEDAARKIEAWGASAVGCNCSSGPAIVLSVVERMRRAVAIPIMAMPNAGMPRSVDGRSIYLTSPEYMASFARKFIRAGASFVGGCCGTSPNHVRAMRGALRAIEAQQEGAEQVEVQANATETAIEPPRLEDRSRIGQLIATGEFCTLVEIVPPRGIDASREIEGAAYLHRLGVHAINVPDSPRASARMSAQSLCLQIQQQIGIETVLHYTCRDRNLLIRYPNEAAHTKAREAALDDVRKGVKFSEERLAELEHDRKPLLDEQEFYKGRKLPSKLRQQLDANDAAAAAQRSLVQNQKTEIDRINALYDAELDRLKKLWSGTLPGSMGVLPAASLPAATAIKKTAAK